MRQSLTVAGLLVMLTASTLEAQFVAALDIGGGIGNAAASASLRETRVGPALRLYGARGFLHTESSLLERAGSWRHLSSSIDAALTSRPIGAGVLQLSFGASGRADSTLPASLLREARLTGALSASVGRSGVWIGGAMQNRVSPGLVAGVWRSLGNAVISISTSRRSEAARAMRFRTQTIPGWDSVWTDTAGWVTYETVREFTDTTWTTRRRSWSDVEGRIDWAMGRVALTFMMAGRDRSDSAAARLWGRMSAAVRLAPRVSLLASAGSMPPLVGAPPRANERFVTVGFRLSHAPLARAPVPAPVRAAATSFSITAAGDETYRVAIRAPGARTVEISGDFNAWTPIALRETAPDLWEATVPLTAGTHRISVRINGERWLAPPGVPSVDDEFNGRVGVVAVR